MQTASMLFPTGSSTNAAKYVGPECALTPGVPLHLPPAATAAAWNAATCARSVLARVSSRPLHTHSRPLAIALPFRLPLSQIKNMPRWRGQEHTR